MYNIRPGDPVTRDLVALLDDLLARVSRLENTTGAPPLSVDHDPGGDVVKISGTEPATVAVTWGTAQNNYDPGDAAIVYVTLTANVTLTGIEGGTDGRRITFIVISGAFKLTLAHQNAGSSAANRLIVPGGTAGEDRVIDAATGLVAGVLPQPFEFIYNGNTSRWTAGHDSAAANRDGQGEVTTLTQEFDGAKYFRANVVHFGSFVGSEGTAFAGLSNTDTVYWLESLSLEVGNRIAFADDETTRRAFRVTAGSYGPGGTPVDFVFDYFGPNVIESEYPLTAAIAKWSGDPDRPAYWLTKSGDFLGATFACGMWVDGTPTAAGAPFPFPPFPEPVLPIGTLPLLPVLRPLFPPSPTRPFPPAPHPPIRPFRNEAEVTPEQMVNQFLFGT